MSEDRGSHFAHRSLGSGFVHYIGLRVSGLYKVSSLGLQSSA